MGKSRYSDVDVDEGLFGIAGSGSNEDETSTPGQPDEMTSTPAERVVAMRVPPNPKCNGCLHYDSNQSACTVGLVPASCGDGTEPETGYSPLVPDGQAYMDWRARRGAAYTAPKAQAGEPSIPEGPAYVVQVLGDSTITKGGTMKSHKPKLGSGKRFDELEGQLAHKKGVTDPKALAAAIGRKKYGKKRFAQLGKSEIATLAEHLGATVEAVQAAVEKALAVPKTSAPPHASPAVQAVKQRKMGQKPSEASMRSAKMAGGGKVFNHASLAAHLGVSHQQLAAHAAQAQHSQHFVQAIQHHYPDKAAKLTSGQIRSAYHSMGLEHSVRDNDLGKGLLKWGPHSGGVDGGSTATHSSGSYTVEPTVGKREQALGGHSVFHTTRSGIKKIGVASSASRGRRMAERHAAGLKPKMSKSISSIRFVDLVKSYVSKADKVIDHTSSGKPIYANAKGADGYTLEEHSEAAEAHGRLADRLNNAIYGTNGYGSSSGKAHHTAAKYLREIADHHRHIAMRHEKTLYTAPVQGQAAAPQTTGFAVAKSLGAPKPPKAASVHSENAPHGTYHVEAQGAGIHAAYFTPKRGKNAQLIGRSNSLDTAKQQISTHKTKFSKSVASLGPNPTDAEIAKAMMAGGGAGALVHGGFVPGRDRVEYGLPDLADAQPVEDMKKVETIQNPLENDRPRMVGGVPSLAYDLTHYRG